CCGHFDFTCRIAKAKHVNHGSRGSHRLKVVDGKVNSLSTAVGMLHVSCIVTRGKVIESVISTVSNIIKGKLNIIQYRWINADKYHITHHITGTSRYHFSHRLYVHTLCDGYIKRGNGTTVSIGHI